MQEQASGLQLQSFQAAVTELGHHIGDLGQQLIAREALLDETQLALERSIDWKIVDADTSRLERLGADLVTVTGSQEHLLQSALDNSTGIALATLEASHQRELAACARTNALEAELAALHASLAAEQWTNPLPVAAQADVTQLPLALQNDSEEEEWSVWQSLGMCLGVSVNGESLGAHPPDDAFYT